MKLGASTAVLLALFFAAPAQAATSPNSCRYSFDNLYRDMAVTLDTEVTPDGEVIPGDVVETATGRVDIELPEYLAPFGYAVGLLKAGRNDIPVKVWLAIRGTNTAERVQVVGPITTTATTTITVDPADDNRFLSATPWTYTTPVVPALTWTAVGGDVAISQASAGAITTQLPVGVGGAMRTVTGSAVILTEFEDDLSMAMDCRPGRTTLIEFDFAGPSYQPLPPTPVATLAGPKNLMCITSADTLEPIRGLLSVAGAPPEYVVGAPYTLPGVALETDTAYTAATVTIAASNTREGTQTVAPGVATTWTPTGAGPIAFTLALPRSSAPYGSVQLTDAGGTLDCSPAAIRGHYEFLPNLDTPVFATAVKHVDPVVDPPPPDPSPVPIVAPQPTPTATPTPRRGTVSVRTTRLVAKRGKVKLRIACSKSGPCAGRLVVRAGSKTLVRTRSYSLAAGKARTYTLTIKRTRATKVRVTLTPTTGRPVSKALRLRR